MVNVAGLTLGNAAAAMLVTREALAGGGARLVEMIHQTRAQHWDLCRAPVDGHFTRSPRVVRVVGACGARGAEDAR